MSGTLIDPTIHAVTWGTELRDGGTIIRQDGSRQTFLDLDALQEPANGAAATLAAKTARGLDDRISQARGAKANLNPFKN